MTTSVDLPDALDQFIEDEVESEKYGSKSEVIRDAIRLLMRQEASIDPNMLSEKAQKKVDRSLEEINQEKKVKLKDIETRYDL